jgi:hypothetical protein
MRATACHTIVGMYGGRVFLLLLVILLVNEGDGDYDWASSLGGKESV